MKRLLGLLFLCGIGISCSKQQKQEEPYVPSEEMKPAYTVITEAIEDNGKQAIDTNYDLI